MIHTKDKRLRIVVGVNSLVSTTQPAYSNHCQFWFRLGRSHPDIDFTFVNPCRMGIDRMRNMCATVAIDMCADYILFLDDDVIVPIDGLARLLECNADVAAGDVMIRGYPFNHMAFRENLISDNVWDVRNLKAVTKWRDDDPEIVPVDAVGFSFCLLKVSSLLKVPSPWFVTGTRNTEDVYYCVKLRWSFKEAHIVIDRRIKCAHILWAEYISIDNKANYIKYMEAQYGPQEGSILAVLPIAPPLFEEDVISNQLVSIESIIMQDVPQIGKHY